MADGPLPAGVRSDRDVEQVLQRWRPDTPAPDLVAVTGPPGSGRTALCRTLSDALHPVRVTDGSDPAASVVVVTLDASAPLGREELGLLAAATADGTPAICSLTRTDMHAGWRSVLRRDTELLAAHAPGPSRRVVLPVSTVTGLGVAELVAEVRAALDEASARTVHQVRLERARTLARSTLADLRRDDETTTVRERRAALVADRDAPRAESAAALRRSTALARVDLVHRVGDRVRAVTAALRGEIDRADRAALRAIPDRVRDELATLVADLDEETTTALDRVAAEVLGPGSRVSGSDRRLPAVDDPQPRHRGVEDRMMIVLGASAGAGLGRLVVTPLSGVAALDAVTLPVTLVVGGVAAWLLTRMRGLAADRAHTRTWVAESMTQARSVLEQRVQARLVEAEAEIVEGIARAHRRRTRDTEAAVAALDRELRESAARTSGRVAAVERDLIVLDRAIATGGEPTGHALRPNLQ